jgi:hypothetical protein
MPYSRHRIAARYGIAVLLSLLLVVGLGFAHRSALRPVSHSDNQRLYLAEQFLIKKCMRNLGFRYWIVPYGDLPAMTFQTSFAIPALATARAHGFHPASAPPPFNQAPANAYYARLSAKRQAAWTAAITGNPGGSGRIPAVEVRLPQGVVMGHSRLGCVASAEKQLYGNYQAWFAAENTVQALRAIVVQSVLRDGAYARAARRWSWCMNARGYPASSPPKARAAFANRVRAAPTVREIAVATATAGCANRTGMAGVIRGLESRYWTGLSRPYRKEFEIYRKLALAALSTASTVLAAQQSEERE